LKMIPHEEVIKNKLLKSVVLGFYREQVAYLKKLNSFIWFVMCLVWYLNIWEDLVEEELSRLFNTFVLLLSFIFNWFGLGKVRF